MLSILRMPQGHWGDSNHRFQLSGAMQLSLTRHKELFGEHREMSTVIGNRPPVPQGLRILCWQKGRAKEGSRP